MNNIIKLVVAISDDPSYTPRIVNQLVSRHTDVFLVSGVLVKKRRLAELLFYYLKVFRWMGCMAFLKYTLWSCWQIIFDRFKRRNITATLRDKSIPVFTCVSQIPSCDILLSIGYPLKFDCSTLNIRCRLGGINLHCGKLPKYRGQFPLYWAMVSDDKELVMTVHCISDEIDQGPIVEELALDQKISLHAMYEEVVLKAPLIIERSLVKILDSRFSPNKQLGDETQYWGFPTAQSRRELERLGRRLI